MHMRANGSDDINWRVTVKEQHIIDRIQGRDQGHPFVFIIDGPALAFQPARTRVAVYPHDQHIPQHLCLAQQPDMPEMENIENAIGEDNSLPGLARGLKLASKFRQFLLFRVLHYLWQVFALQEALANESPAPTSLAETTGYAGRCQ